MSSQTCAGSKVHHRLMVIDEKVVVAGSFTTPSQPTSSTESEAEWGHNTCMSSVCWNDLMSYEAAEDGDGVTGLYVKVDSSMRILTDCPQGVPEARWPQPQVTGRAKAAFVDDADNKG